MTTSIFDKKFVTTAVILAAVYAGIVIIVNKILGKEAAGVAGVALTALATAIFKQFESLRFQTTPAVSGTSTTVSTLFSWWKVLLIAFLFSGITRLFIELVDGVVPLLFHPTTPYLADFYTINGKLINHYTIWEQSTKCIAYLLSGIIATRAFKKISFSVIVIAGLIGVILDFYNETLWYIFFGSNTFSSITMDLEDYKYSFLWVVFSFLGSYISQKRDEVFQNATFFKRNKVLFTTLGISILVLLIFLLVPKLFSHDKEEIQFSDASMKYQFLGEKEFDKKKYSRALLLFDSALEVNASASGAYYFKGYCY